jgi:alpha-mannosidase
MDSVDRVSESSLLISIDRLRGLSQIDILTDWGIYRGDISTDADLGEWDGVCLNEKGNISWERGRQVVWLGQRLVIPSHVEGYPVSGLLCRLALTWWADVAQVYVDGKLVQEGDLFDHSARVLLTIAAIPGTVIDVRLRLVSPGHDIGALMRSRLIYESSDLAYPEPGWLADELAVMVKQVGSFEPTRLEQAADIIESIDYTLLDRDSHLFIRHILDIKQQLKSIATFADRSIDLLGHAHLDIAWLWEVAETWEVAERTFRSALDLQAQFSQLTFCHSTPALYEWIEQHQPALFDRILAQVKAGKWEVVGGMWIEPDLNLISGESIARQIIYGQQYTRSKFGNLTQVSWLPDTFGFCAQLPQLLKQGGIDYFVTQKFLWNDTTKFPHQLFWWESPDGSRVLSLMSSPIGEGIDPLKMIDYACEWENSTGINESLWLFGVGDHGGGPTRDMLELADRWSKSDVFPDLKFTTAAEYLTKLAGSKQSQTLPICKDEIDLEFHHDDFTTHADRERSNRQCEDLKTIPIWKDELYLEFHRGCFTTHADQKRSNRQCEDLLYQAELWSSLASIVTKQGYPDETRSQIEVAWKQTLFNQFHDIIPGTAIAPVYITANEGWEKVEGITTQIISDALAQISDRILLPSPPVEGAIPIVIFNALNWKRSEVVSIPTNPRLLQEVGDLGTTWIVFDGDGNLLPSQSSANDLLFLAVDLPSVGYRLYWLALDESSSLELPLQPDNPPPAPPRRGVREQRLSISTEIEDSSDFIFKNQFLEVEIDAQTGDIASIWDKTNHRQIITDGNQLQAFKDSEQYWDAWNIDPKYAEHILPPSELKSIEWIETGAIRQRLRVVRTVAGTEFTQDYSLDAHEAIVRIKTTVDWQAEHILIKANFPLNLTADRSTAETACGATCRTTIPTTPAESAKWELPAHRWVDLTDNSGEYGVSILNDCKYGFDAGTNHLRLTLLRSSKWPDPIADRGYHEFTYAIYPHSGTWQAAQTVRKGYELNSPLQVFQLSPTARKNDNMYFASDASLIDLQAENLILMAFKPSDLNQSWVLRCYECHGVEGEIKLNGDVELKIDRVVNLLEESQGEVDSIVKPWQIRSFSIST